MQWPSYLLLLSCDQGLCCYLSTGESCYPELISIIVSSTTLVYGVLVVTVVVGVGGSGGAGVVGDSGVC